MKNILNPIGKTIENLFLWSSGASLEILKEVPSEKNKFFGIGGTVLFTALMATLAGGYAFFTAFKDTGLSVAFGIFWGCLIFNLDRYIVSSFGVGDGEKTISKQELKDGAPRIIMAIILGLVVSTPLEMKLFEKEISVKVVENNARKKAASAKEATDDPVLKKLYQDKENILREGKQRDSLLSAQINASQQASKNKNDELYFGAFSKRKGKGETYQSLNQIATAAQGAANQTLQMDQQTDLLDMQRLTQINLDISTREKEVAENLGRVNQVQETTDGFLARLEALGDLTSESTTVFVCKWMISLLFILIEIAPILFKMLTERGPYDDILDRVKYETKVRQMQMQSNINQEINTAVQIHTAKFAEKLKAEMQTNEEVLKAVAKAQQELALIAIAKWKEEQKAKMQQTDLHGVASSTFG